MGRTGVGGRGGDFSSRAGRMIDGEANVGHEKFIFLGKNADPSLPEVVDARKRLDGWR